MMYAGKLEQRLKTKADRMYIKLYNYIHGYDQRWLRTCKHGNKMNLDVYTREREGGSASSHDNGLKVSTGLDVREACQTVAAGLDHRLRVRLRPIHVPLHCIGMQPSIPIAMTTTTPTPTGPSLRGRRRGTAGVNERDGRVVDGGVRLYVRPTPSLGEVLVAATSVALHSTCLVD